MCVFAGKFFLLLYVRMSALFFTVAPAHPHVVIVVVFLDNLPSDRGWCGGVFTAAVVSVHLFAYILLVFIYRPK